MPQVSDQAHGERNESSNPRQHESTGTTNEFYLINRIRHQLHHKNLDAIRFYLHLPPFGFVVCWWLMVLLHLVAVMFLVTMMRLYHWLLHYNMEYMLANLTFQISYPTLEVMSWSFVVVVGLHMMKLVVILFRSLQARELRFHKVSSVTNEPVPGIFPTASGLLHTSVPPNQTTQSSGRLPPLVVGTVGSDLRSTWRGFYYKWIQCIQSVFFIYGAFFEWYLVCREYAEVAAQVYQAYQMSVLISTRWLNHVFVTMIVLNCMSTPCIHFFFGATSKDLPSRRVLSLVSSFVLNLCNSIVVPLVIFMPYVHAYDPSIQYFAGKYTMDDIWYTTAVRENQMVFITSAMDFLATWMPHFSLFSCLHTMENLLRRRNATVTPSAIAVIPEKTPRATSCPTRTLTQQELILQQQPTTGPESSPTCDPPSEETSKGQSRFGRVIAAVLAAVPFGLLAVIGVVVLGFHFLAQRVKVMPGCKLHSAPWFTTKSSCVIMNINCHRLEMDGNEHAMAKLLTQLNQFTLFQLILSHCPHLQIPSALQAFVHLGGLDLYNVSLDQWPLTASLRQESHPFMNYVYVFRSNLSGIPDGLLNAHFPQGLEEMYFYDVNLTVLPTDLHEVWATPTYLSFDKCQFQEFPSTLSKMSLESLTFTSNPVQVLRDDLFTNHALLSLRLSGTELQLLPNETRGDLSTLTRLTLEYTNLNHVPDYIRQWFAVNHAQGIQVEHSLYGSPFCNRTTMDQTWDDLELQQYWEQVCAQDVSSVPEDEFITAVDAQRPW